MTSSTKMASSKLINRLMRRLVGVLSIASWSLKTLGKPLDKKRKKDRETFSPQRDGLQWEHPADHPEYDPYNHGPAHGLVETTMKKTSLTGSSSSDPNKQKISGTSKDASSSGGRDSKDSKEKAMRKESKGALKASDSIRTKPAEFVSRVLTEFESEDTKIRAGLALGAEKGEVISRQVADRYAKLERQKIAEALEKANAISGKTYASVEELLLETSAGYSANSDVEKKHMLRLPEWEVNILELGSHLGDGTLRILQPLIDRMMKSKVLPARIRMISVEHSHTWLSEGKRLVDHSLAPMKDIEFDVTNLLLDEKSKSYKKDRLSRSRDVIPFRDLIEYHATDYDADVHEFSLIARVSFLEAYEIKDGFDFLILDHEERRFLGDMTTLMELDGLNEGCLVIADNIVRKRYPLQEYIDYVDNQDWCRTKSFSISQPYADVMYVTEFLKSIYVKNFRDEDSPSSQDGEL